MIVLDFAEQPVLILFAGLSFHSDEQPFALHPFPMQNEMEMSFLKVFCALARDRLPASFVPQHDVAAAIFLRRNRPFDPAIDWRMILRADSQSLVRRIRGCPPRQRTHLE